MNWSVYDDSLVRRGDVLLDFTVLDGWGFTDIKITPNDYSAKFLFV